MSRHEVRSYDYVNSAYARVREALVADPSGIFRDATRSASVRARSLAAELHVKIAGVDVAAEIVVATGQMTEEPGGFYGMPVTRLPVSWEAAHHPELFPKMKGVLSICPLTPSETELEFFGQYEPPLGAVGDAFNDLVGHRVAEAAVHRLVADIARHLHNRFSES